MKIDQLLTAQPVVLTDSRPTNEDNSETVSFGEFLKKALNEVNNLQVQSEEMKQKLVTGQIENVHDVMIAAEKANLAFELTLQVRNKIVEAYQEIMRMQV
ncbi:flagellar hook-basal body complex subunit FliE [Thermincola ferriacetica]|uniref:Flagellar hook-basal body complex protein FliE n=2 Tax=Thermincola TaxID=278993 RepID=D5XFH5_THEPJ|nr:MULTISPECIES: flagellar hook-basal body complex protein FliE [Thermincola]ADG82396.1 flagellar hook-basal body complex subunit FliE [Thermincola potens JR]KNZ70889.1 flagellar hook-basal body complex subunit FliE [Thermincola ferriacetica]